MFTVQTLTFRTLYVFVVIDHGRRRIRHWNVTEHPIASWIWRQMIEATAWGQQRGFLRLRRTQALAPAHARGHPGRSLHRGAADAGAESNIRKLVRIARTLAGHSLSEVVEYLEQRRDDLDAREGPAVLDRTDAVQLMTVHASKGLEFPIVFVPEAHLTARGSYPAVRWRRGRSRSAR